jgi:hypothetical protein
MIPADPTDLTLFVWQDRRGWWYGLDMIERYEPGDPPATEDIAASIDGGPMTGPFDTMEACMTAAKNAMGRNLRAEYGP